MPQRPTVYGNWAAARAGIVAVVGRHSLALLEAGKLPGAPLEEVKEALQGVGVETVIVPMRPSRKALERAIGADMGIEVYAPEPQEIDPRNAWDSDYIIMGLEQYGPAVVPEPWPPDDFADELLERGYRELRYDPDDYYKTLSVGTTIAHMAHPKEAVIRLVEMAEAIHYQTYRDKLKGEIAALKAGVS